MACDCSFGTQKGVPCRHAYVAAQKNGQYLWNLTDRKYTTRAWKDFRPSLPAATGSTRRGRPSCGRRPTPHSWRGRPSVSAPRGSGTRTPTSPDTAPGRPRHSSPPLVKRISESSLATGASATAARSSGGARPLPARSKDRPSDRSNARCNASRGRPRVAGLRRPAAAPRHMSSFAPPEADSAQTPVYGQEPEPEPELDGDGYRSLTLKQHVGRLLSVVVFVIMRPLGAAARG